MHETVLTGGSQRSKIVTRRLGRAHPKTNVNKKIIIQASNNLITRRHAVDPNVHNRQYGNLHQVDVLLMIVDMPDFPKVRHS